MTQMQQTTSAKAVQLAFAYAMEHHVHQPGQMKDLLQAQVNMMKFYKGDMKEVGKFFAAYPEAISILPHWMEQDTNQARQIISEFNTILNDLPHQATVQQVQQQLGNPATISDLMKAVGQVDATSAMGAK